MNLNPFKKQATPDLVAEIKRKLEAEQARFAVLTIKHQSLAFDAETTGDNAALNDLAFEITHSRGRIETLHAALREAQQRQAAAEQERIAAARQEKIAAWRKTLEKRAATASKLTTALVPVIKMYRELQEISQQAARSHPDGAFQIGWLLSEGEIHTAIGEELARLWDNPQIGEAYRFPGSTRAGQTYDPGKLPDLATVAWQANEHAFAGVKS